MRKNGSIKRTYNRTEKEILRFIKKARRRINACFFLDTLLLSLCISVSLAAVLCAAALFIPIVYLEIWGAVIVLAGVLAAVLYCLFHVKGLPYAAGQIDRTGLQERVSTSYERLGEEDAFSRLLKQDALSHLRETDMKKSFPFRISWKKTVWLFFSAMLVLLLSVIWTPARETAGERRQIAKVIREEKKKLDVIQNKLEKAQEMDLISKEQMEQLDKLLEETKEEAKQAESKEDLEKTKKRLEAKAEQFLEQVDDKELLQAFGKALDKENMASLQQFKKQVSELAKKNEAVADAAEALKNLGEYLSEAEQEKLAAAMKEAQAAGTLNQNALKGILESLDNVDASVAASKLANGTLAQNKEQPGQEGNQNDSGNDGNGAGGQKGGNGQDSAGSTKDSNGQDGTGGRKDNREKNGGSNTSGAGSGWDYGSKKGIEKEYQGEEKTENVFVSDREQGNDKNLEGKDTGGKSYKQDSKTSAAWSGTKTDYNSVVGQYKKEALASMEKGKIPSSMQDIVKAYFSSLE